MRVLEAHHHPVWNMQHMNEVYAPIALTCLTIAMTWIASLHNASCRNIACSTSFMQPWQGSYRASSAETCAAAVCMA